MNNSYNIENGKGEVPPSWWKKRSRMEKRLSVFSVSALLLVIILIIVIIIYFTRGPTTCLSASCVQTTSELLDHMDLDANPCEDFYQFACGTFIDNVELEEERFKTVETFLSEDVEHKLQAIIDEPIDHNHDSRSLVSAKKLYIACMNETAMEEQGLRLIKNHLRQIGGWPVLDGGNWQERNFEWKEATYRLRHLGYRFQFFIGFDIIRDEVDTTKNVIRLFPAYSLLQRASDEEEEQLYNYMVNLSIAFGADKARAKNEARDVIDFGKSLFYNPHDDEDDDDDKYDPLTVSELQYKFHDIPWLEYFNTLLAMIPNITHDQLVTVSNPSYFIRLQNALRRITKRVVANYICWRTVSENSLMLTPEVQEIHKDFLREMTKNEIPPRSERCTVIVIYMFHHPLQAVYIRRYFSKTAKTRVNEMLQNIKDEFKEVVNDLDWLDEETRKGALERISTSKQFVAFSEDLLDDDKIEESYLGVQVDEDNFLMSYLNVQFYLTNENFRRLHEPSGKDDLLYQLHTMNIQSHYSASDNSIGIPVGLLQGVIYDEDRPQYLNYGALGSTLGHQVFHIVFQGNSCHQDSKYYQWLTPHALTAYNDKLSCVERHYGKYAVPEIGEYLNSSNTRQEDAADIAGVKLAYDAYNSWVSRNGPEKKLPGLDYTPRQLFWISSAVRYCGKATREALEAAVAHNYRSLGKFRAIGTLANSEEFAYDFGCPRDSRMNVEEKCKIL